MWERGAGSAGPRAPAREGWIRSPSPPQVPSGLNSPKAAPHRVPLCPVASLLLLQPWEVQGKGVPLCPHEEQSPLSTTAPDQHPWVQPEPLGHQAQALSGATLPHQPLCGLIPRSWRGSCPSAAPCEPPLHPASIHHLASGNSSPFPSTPQSHCRNPPPPTAQTHLIIEKLAFITLNEECQWVLGRALQSSAPWPSPATRDPQTSLSAVI